MTRGKAFQAFLRAGSSLSFGMTGSNYGEKKAAFDAGWEAHAATIKAPKKRKAPAKRGPSPSLTRDLRVLRNYGKEK